MRVLLDANIYVSYLIASFENPSSIRDVVELGLSQSYELLVPDLLIRELTTVVTRPKFEGRIHPSDVEQLVKILERVGTLIDTSQLSTQRTLDDPKDDYLIAAAQFASADFLVSGDRHLLGVRDRFASPVIVSPTEFLNRLIGR